MTTGVADEHEIADVDELERDLEEIIGQFFAGVPFALKKHREISPPPPIFTLDDHNKHSAESISCINRILSAIETHKDELSGKATSDIYSYLKKYRVRSHSCDPLKFAYWFRMALSNKLGEHYDLDRKVVLTLTTLILNMFCEWHNGKKLSEDLRTKLDISIAQNKVAEDFGQYGIYLSFKAISNV
jgi:hypothetical protein